MTIKQRGVGRNGPTPKIPSTKSTESVTQMGKQAVFDLNEKAFVGALLHLPPDRVIALGELVHPDDLSDPRLRLVFKIALDLAGKGEQPDVAKVHGEARTAGTVVSQNLPSLALLLTDLLDGCPNPAAADYYGRNVLESSLRRRTVAAATRLCQAAESSSLEMLCSVIEEETTSLARAIHRLASSSLGGAV